MVEWDKYKVVELKEECKARKISVTGLKLKQQYIDKLVDYETKSEDAAPAEESVAEETDGTVDEVAKDEQPTTNPVEDTQPPEAQADSPRDFDRGKERDVNVTKDVPSAVEADESLPENRPATLEVEDSRASDAKEDEGVPVAGKAQEAEAIEEHDLLVPQSEQLEPEAGDDTDVAAQATVERRPEYREAGEANEQLGEAVREKEPTPMPISNESERASCGARSSTEEESRKRKRRSLTPPPNAEVVQKKAKTISGSAVVMKRASRSPSPTLLHAHEDTAMAQAPGETKVDATESPPLLKHIITGQERSKQHLTAHDSPAAPDDENTIAEPALHAATRSLYMRNLKRPLNVQALKSHIKNIAQRSSSVATDQDPLTFSYVNNIRSHAFYTFSSISTASGVRSVMHDTRFPDEPQRDPLFVDFVPEDRVED